MIGKKSGQEEEHKLVDIEGWHNRYLEQACWTANLRSHLLGKSQVKGGDIILDIGCGTGALVPDFHEEDLDYIGLDLDPVAVGFAKNTFPESTFLLADGLSLPFPNNFFDLTICHFLLMWVEDPCTVLREMVRVTKPGGEVIAFAEPDYGGRIDYPTKLKILADYQVASLLRQGANPSMGRELRKHFTDANLTGVTSGVIGGEWSDKPDWKAWESEWRIIKSDIFSLDREIPEEELFALRETDKQAYADGSRILFVPTFFARVIAP